MRLRGFKLAGLVATIACATIASTPAAAQSSFMLTLVARECPSYTAIMANRARNNIQESLQDLGADAVYQAGDPVSPSVEDANDGCVPMAVPWTFTLGSGISGTDTGTYGSLSRVSGVFSSVTTTLAGVPQRNGSGAIVGGTIASAVTINLSAAEAQQAASMLWVQGGAPGTPLNNLEDTYAFGALRCAVDALNGDNVESVTYPSGTVHQYCYAYYVNPPPTSGTIVVVKQNQASLDSDFVFRGNLSYTPDPNDAGNAASNFFVLAPAGGASASQTFYRAGGQNWNVREEVPAGWRLTSAGCSTTSGSAVTTNAPGDFSIALAAGDVVTCTFADDIDPPTAGLALLKSSRDGDPDNGFEARGTFGFSVSGPGVSASSSATTLHEGVPVIAATVPDLTGGSAYTVSETWPNPDPRGTWGLDPVLPAYCLTCSDGSCSTVPVAPVATAGGASFGFTMPGSPLVCGFRNRINFEAALQLGKLPEGQGGLFGFTVIRLESPSFTFHDVVDAATPDATTYAATDDALPYGTYRIIEVQSVPGRWMLASISCYDTPPPASGAEGEPLFVRAPSAAGFVDVTLSASQPFLRCVFDNRAVPATAPTAVPVDSRLALALLGLAIALATWQFAGALRRRR